MISYNQLFHDRFRKSQIIDEKFIEIVNTKGLHDAADFFLKSWSNKIWYKQLYN